MSKKKTFVLLQYLIFFGIGFALIYYQYKQLKPQDLADLKTALHQVSDRLWILIPIFIIGFLSHFFRALRWRLMLTPIGVKTGIVNASAAVFIGYLTNLLLPRMGEVAKCTVLAKYENQAADKIIGTIVAERLFDLICLALIALLTFFLQTEMFQAYLSTFQNQDTKSNLPLMISIALFVGLAFIGLLYFLYKRNKEGKIGQFIKGMGQGLGSILNLEKKALFFFYTFCIWASYLSLIYIGFFALAATEHLGLEAALSVLVLGSVGMILTPGGLGAYPQILQYVLHSFYGVGLAFGLAFGWISWLAQTLIMIIFGILSFIVLPIYNKAKNG